MEELDLKLRLFGGEPIEADDYGLIKPLTVREVVNYGYTEYMKSLNIVCVETKDFLKDGSSDEDLEDVNVIDILIAFGGEEIEKELENALSLFLHGEAIIDKEHLCIFLKKSEEEVLKINSSNFDNIKEVIKWQNYVNHFEDNKVDSTPMDEETRKFKERMEKLKKQRDEIKRKKNKDEEGEGQDIDFYDIVSSISSKSYSVNELNVMDLTIYQVYSKFKRMEMIDQYDISIKSILAGASDIKLRHWSTKMD